MSQTNQMSQMFGQMMMWPMSMFADMFSRSMQGMQCLPAPCAPSAPAPVPVACPPREADRGTRGDWGCSPRRDDTWGGGSRGCGCGCDCGSCRSGSCCHHCGCDTVRLVEYSVVNIARGSRHDRETPAHCRQMLLRDCETAEEFTNQVIAEYAREHPHVDAKNLRVYFKVLDCWCKEQWDYEEEQIDALRQIRNAIARGDRERNEGQGQGR